MATFIVRLLRLTTDAGVVGRVEVVASGREFSVADISTLGAALLDELAGSEPSPQGEQ